MAKYVLIGGGDDTPFIQEIVCLSGKEHPRMLCIGVADTDTLEVRGCEVEQLSFEDILFTAVAKAKIDRADILCIADENAAKLMRCFKRYGIDAMLAAAANEDKMLCGVGEGATVLCAFGQSCADKLTSRRVKGLGLVDIVFCPHIIDEPQRTGWLKAIMKRTPRLTAAALDHAALVIDGDRFCVLSSPETSRARKCYWYKKQYYTDNIKSSEWHSLKKLMHKV